MRTQWLLLLAVLWGTAGCQSVAPPSWFHPGTAAQQQVMAQQYDPYPETQAGPMLVGARPMEYDKPPAEVLQVQPHANPLQASWLPWNW